MSLEAVPVCLKNGNENVYGIIIRPSTSAHQVNAGAPPGTTLVQASAIPAGVTTSAIQFVPTTNAAIVNASVQCSSGATSALRHAVATASATKPMTITSTAQPVQPSILSSTASSSGSVIPITPKISTASTSTLQLAAFPGSSQFVQIPSWAVTSCSSSAAPAQVMVQYSVPPMALNTTNTVQNAQPTATQREAPTRRSAARKRQSASEKAAAAQHNAYQPGVPQQHTQRSPIASADLQNAHCKVNASGGAFDAPSPSQVVPQMNVNGYDPLSVASTPSSCSYLPPISTLAPSSAGSSTQQLSPPLNDSTLTSAQHNYPTHTSDLQHQYAHHHPSTSAHGFMTDSLGEDLNCIDYTQLLSNAGTITTEEYLPSQQHPTATYVHPGAHDGSQQYGHHVSMQHGGVYGQPPMVHQNVQRVRQTFNQEGTYQQQQQQVMQPKTSACYATYPHPNHTWPTEAYANHGLMPSHHQISSSTPDSGIQSIDGSPPSVSSYTPPMVSPYMTHAASNGECRAPSTPATTCNEVSSTTPEDADNDFSDMPTLLPEGCIPQEESVEQCTTEAPNLVVSSTSKPARCSSRTKNDHRERSRSSASRPSTATGNRSLPFDALSPDAPSSSTFDMGSPSAVLPASCSSDMSIPSVGTPSSGTSVIAITTTMDPKEIWKTLEGTLCAEKLKEIKSLIEAKAAASENAMTGTAAASVVNADRCASGEPSEPAVASSARTHEAPQSPLTKRSNRTEEPHGNDIDERQRVLEYRRHVKAKLRERMQVVIRELDDRFKGIRLDLGRCIKLPLPWQPINWKAVDERMANHAAERRKHVKKARRHQPQVDERRKRKSAENASPDGRRSKRGKKEQQEEQGKKGHRGQTNERTPSMDIYEASPSPSTSSSLKITLIRRPSQDGEDVLSKRLRTNVAADGYTPITKNIFVDPPQAIPAPPACTCDALKPCTENSLCARRLRNAECTEKSCTAGAQDCRNRRISKNRVVPVDALKTFATSRGDRGVCSKLDLKQGQYICEYLGEVVRLKNYKRRSASREPHQPRYGIHLLSNFVVDATQKGNISRFFNHSCQPNCEMQKWLVNGQYRLAIFASEDIPAGQELTYDYSAFHVSLEPRQKCECGEVGCLGTIPAVSPKAAERHAPRLYQRELNSVRASRVFLPRNLMKQAHSLVLRPLPQCHELSAALIKIARDMATFCRQKEQIPKKYITQMHLAVKRALRTCAAPSTSQATVIERFDAAMKTSIQLLSRSFSVPKRRADAIRQHYTQLKRAADFQKTKLPKDAIQTFVDDKRRPALRTKRENVNVVAGEADLSYMDSDHPVGSYDPDKEATKQASYSNEDEDCVRCVCGIMEDDGTMTQCDRCKFWLHADCIDYDGSSSDQELICDFCTKGLDSTPAVDIVLNPQPEIRLQDCHYFKTLANSRGIQVRLNEAVYVERLINDKHKRLLRKFHDRCVKSAATLSKKSEKSRSVTPRKWATPTKSDTKTLTKSEEPVDEPTDGEEDPLSVANIAQKEFDRKDLRIFRVERLFKGPNGERFVFGCYYARPHETFCEPTRQFYKNEIFWTPLFDTLPLDAVVGRCLILDPPTWAKGRPKSPKYLEEDVFICEYQVGKNQRCFEKISSKNKYVINTEPYVFDEFATSLAPKRDFSPFFVSSPAKPDVKQQSPKKDQTASVAKEICTERINAICNRLAELTSKHQAPATRKT